MGYKPSIESTLDDAVQKALERAPKITEKDIEQIREDAKKPYALSIEERLRMLDNGDYLPNTTLPVLKDRSGTIPPQETYRIF